MAQSFQVVQGALEVLRLPSFLQLQEVPCLQVGHQFQVLPVSQVDLPLLSVLALPKVPEVLAFQVDLLDLLFQASLCLLFLLGVLVSLADQQVQLGLEDQEHLYLH